MLRRGGRGGAGQGGTGQAGGWAHGQVGAALCATGAAACGKATRYPCHHAIDLGLVGTQAGKRGGDKPGAALNCCYAGGPREGSLRVARSPATHPSATTPIQRPHHPTASAPAAAPVGEAGGEERKGAALGLVKGPALQPAQHGAAELAPQPEAVCGRGAARRRLGGSAAAHWYPACASASARVRAIVPLLRTERATGLAGADKRPSCCCSFLLPLVQPAHGRQAVVAPPAAPLWQSHFICTTPCAAAHPAPAHLQSPPQA